ncbi:LRIG3 [Branchiostoma lanceolatum]|uniref:LRIG3 protein n=1 Tax=Branchiostoma lanceolatum TaxID=7740 RepID=A0A8J9ZU93_BRALA|nr:LRIG3 [Branchiostoma lanceolatum]
MLFLVLLAAACAASNGPGCPRCMTAGWRECVPSKDMPGGRFYVTSGTVACAMCKAPDKGVAFGNPFRLLSRAKGVAIKGYPFHVLSAKSLTPLAPAVVHALALIDAKSTGVVSNTFAGFSRLDKLSLDANRLTHVKQTWFTGLEKLLVLILSNNHIKQIEPGSFMHLTCLRVLDLENNLLQVVDPSWLFGLKATRYINLGLNEINSISPVSFQYLRLHWIDLRGNDLACLDGEVFRRQSDLSTLHVSSGMLSSVHDAKRCGIMWSLHRSASARRGSTTMVVEVPKFLFCARYSGMTHKLSFGWMFDSLDDVPRNIELGGVNPGRSCGALDRSLSTISIQAPAVVLATTGSLADKLVPNTLEQCRQVWEYNNGITVTLGLVGTTPTFRLVSLVTGNATFDDVALAFVQAQDTNTRTNTESGCSHKHRYPIHTNATHDDTKNITCMLTKDEYTELFFTVPKVQCQTHTTGTTYRTDTDHSSSLTHYSEYTETSSEPGDISKQQASTTFVLVVSAVVTLGVFFLVVLVWKVCATRLNAEDSWASDDAHIWTIPPGVAIPGLLRSSSLPAYSGKMASDDVASCRSLPAVLHSIKPTYSEIPDDVAAAHRPLPGLPHAYSGIPDDAISGVVRSASLPVVTCSRGGGPNKACAGSCRSLPAVLQSIESTYNEILDHIAVVQRPLPALPRTCWEVSDHEAAAHRPLPACNTPQRAPLSLTMPNTYWPWEIPGEGTSNTPRRAPLPLTLPNTYWPWEIPGEGTSNTTQRAPLSLTLPNTYWPWEIPGEGTSNTPRRAPLPLTLPNTYWPWEIPGEGTSNTPQRAPLPLTLPNTYWPWEIPGEGTSNTPRRAPLPLTLPNTYWPWEIPGEGTSNTPQRAPLPLTLPNTYWPWEIPGEGTSNTPRRAPLSLTLPNTYWPWEIPGEGTSNTPRRAPLPPHTA